MHADYVVVSVPAKFLGSSVSYDPANADAAVDVHFGFIVHVFLYGSFVVLSATACFVVLDISAAVCEWVGFLQQ